MKCYLIHRVDNDAVVGKAFALRSEFALVAFKRLFASRDFEIVFGSLDNLRAVEYNSDEAFAVSYL